MFYSNIYKNQQHFHKKMFKIKQIKQIKTTSIKNKQNYNPNFLKNAFLFLFSFFNIFLTYKLLFFLFEEENLQTNKETESTIISKDNNSINKNDIGGGETWFNSTNILYGGIFIIIIGTCIYYMYSNDIDSSVLISSTQNVNDAFFENINFDLVVKHIKILEYYLVSTEDIQILQEIIAYTNKFLEKPLSFDGEVAFKMLIKILNQIAKTDNITNYNHHRIIVRTLNNLIKEFRNALEKS